MTLALAMLATAVAAAASVAWLVPGTRRPGLAEAAVASALGYCLTGVLFVLARVAGADPGTAGVTVMAVMIGLAVATAVRRGRRLWPTAPEWSDRAVLATGVIAAIWMAHVTVSAWAMGQGDFPPMFFNIDTPFRLNHVHELLRGRGFPPQSIANAGVIARDHFGGPAAAAALAQITGLAPHTALFAVMLPVAALGVFGASVLLVGHLVPSDARGLRVAGLVAVLMPWTLPVRAAFDSVRESLTSGAMQPLRAYLGTLWRDPQSFNNYVEDVTHALGRVLLLLVVTALVAPAPRALAAAAFAVVLLGQIKSGHVVVAGVVLGVAGLWHAVQLRRVWPLGLVAVAAAGSQLLLRLGGVGSLFRLVIEPGWMLKYFPDVALRDGLSAAVVLTVPVALWLTTPARRGTMNVDRPLGGLLAVVAGVYGLFQVLGAHGVRLSWQPGATPVEVPYREFLEPLGQMPLVVATMAVAMAAAVWSHGPRWRRTALLVFLALLVGPGVLHRIRHTAIMASEPSRGHEQADNRAIGDALGAIPVAGAIVATNDLRYPAQFYDRDLRQFQVSAVRGHQAFGLPGYERYEGWEQRVVLQRALAGDDQAAASSAVQALADHGVTHLLIHKKLRAPDLTARRRLFDSDDYAVYALDAR